MYIVSVDGERRAFLVYQFSSILTHSLPCPFLGREYGQTGLFTTALFRQPTERETFSGPFTEMS